MSAVLAQHPESAASTAGFDPAEPRSLIGRRLLLRRNLIGFPPGTSCRVQCVVDFGEGHRLCISSAGDDVEDMEHIDIEDLGYYFTLPGDETAARAPSPDAGTRSPASRMAAIWAGLRGFPAALADAVDAYRLVEQHRRQGGGALALGGTGNAALVEQIRQRLQRRD